MFLLRLYVTKVMNKNANEQVIRRPLTSVSEALAKPFHYVFSCVFPLTLMFSVAPSFLVIWLSCKALSVFTPQTRRIFQEFDDFMWSSYQRIILFFAENWTSSKFFIYGDTLPESTKRSRENVIFICNHQSSFDWVATDMIAVRNGCLGNLRYVLKDSLRFIPMYGYYFKQHGCLYVKRGRYDADSYRQQLIDLTKRGIFWLVIYPEGTRYKKANQNSIEANRKYAEKYGLPTYELVLTPRHRGIYHAIQTLGPHVDAVYDITVAYEPHNWKPDGTQPNAPSMASYLRGCCNAVHVHTTRIPRSELPTEEHAFAGWLCDRFRIKNDMLKKFYTNGGALDGKERPQPHRLPLMRHTLSYIVAALGITAVFYATDIGRAFYKWSVIGGSAVTMAWVTLVPDRLQ